MINVFTSNALNIETYIIHLLEINSLDDIEENNLEEILIKKFNSMFNSAILTESIKQMKKVFKTESKNFQLYLIKDIFTKTFFHRIFAPPNPSSDDFKIVQLLGEGIKQVLYNLIDPNYKQNKILMILENMRVQLDNLTSNKIIDKRKIDAIEKVWNNLAKLKLAGYKLWERASDARIDKFRTIWDDTYIEINTKKLYIKQKYYSNLNEVLNLTQDYIRGKIKLNRLKKLIKSETKVPIDAVEQIIENNRILKIKYENILDKIIEDFSVFLGSIRN